MAQSVSTFRPFFRGCLRMEETEEGCVLHRFTPRQMKAYEGPQGRRLRAMCPAGVCLDFVGDARMVKLAFTVKGTCRDRIFFDVYVNDTLVRSIGQSGDAGGLREIEFEIPNPATENRVTVYLPHCVELVLRGLEAPAGHLLREAPARAGGNLLCVGDSITQGMDASKPSQTYPALLARLLNMNLLNQGVGGHVFDEATLDAELPYRPDIVTVAYGTNDWGRHKTVDSFFAACRDYLAQLDAIFPGAAIYVLTPIWRRDADTPKAMGTFSELVRAIDRARTGRMVLVDGLTLVPHLPEYYDAGVVHPVDMGFMHYGVNLARAIRAHEARDPLQRG